MWLINAKTLQLRKFEDEGNSFPKQGYAVLSHTWSQDPADELSFRELKSGRALKHEKLLHMRRLTLDHGLDWFWIDTCCIPTKPAEERLIAIHSMYVWYYRAKVCFVHLADVRLPSKAQRGQHVIGEHHLCQDWSVSDHLSLNPYFPSDESHHIRWFTRGWTLQELVAPKAVKFYTRSWQYLGCKEQLADKISSITGIPEPILAGVLDLSTTSLEERIQWIATRQLKLESDRPYCLLGLCDLANPHLWYDTSRTENLRNELLRVYHALNEPEYLQSSIAKLDELSQKAESVDELDLEDLDDENSDEDESISEELNSRMSQVSLAGQQATAVVTPSVSSHPKWVWSPEHKMYYIHSPSERCYIFQNGVRLPYLTSDTS